MVQRQKEANDPELMLLRKQKHYQQLADRQLKEIIKAMISYGRISGELTSTESQINDEEEEEDIEDDWNNDSSINDISDNSGLKETEIPTDSENLQAALLHFRQGYCSGRSQEQVVPPDFSQRSQDTNIKEGKTHKSSKSTVFIYEQRESNMQLNYDHNLANS